MSETITITYETKEPQIIEVSDLQFEVSWGENLVELTFSTRTRLLDFKDFNSCGTKWKEIRYTGILNGKLVCVRLTNKLGRLLFFKEISTDGTMTYQTETEDFEILPASYNSGGIIPYQEEKEEDEELKTNIIFVRFADSSGKFTDKTKIYPYEVSRGELFESITLGNIIKITQLQDRYFNKTINRASYSPSYSNTEVRVEGKLVVNSSDVPDVIEKSEWKDIRQTQYMRSELTPNWVNNFINKLSDKNCSYHDGKLFYQIDEKEVTYETIRELYVKEMREEFSAIEAQKKYEVLQKNLETESIVGCRLFPNEIEAAEELRAFENVLKTEETLKPLVNETLTVRNGKGIYITSNNKEEKNTMSEIFKNIFGDMQFGKLTTDKIKYSISGVAFADKNEKFFVYKDNRAIDVTGMIINAPMFAMPVAVNQIQPNDVIRFKNDYVIVKELVEDGVKVVNPIDGDIRTIIPQVNVFGFNYITKVINPFEGFTNTANETNPFGNIMPFMLMGDLKGDKDDMFKFMLMSQMGNGTNMNQMLPFMLMSDSGKDNDFFTMMMMTQMMGNGAPFNFNANTQVNKD